MKNKNSFTPEELRTLSQEEIHLRLLDNTTYEQHKHCRKNKEEIGLSTECGCFYCLETFPPSKIERWVGPDRKTALCPICGIDAVLGNSAVRFDRELLVTMRKEWF